MTKNDKAIEFAKEVKNMEEEDKKLKKVYRDWLKSVLETIYFENKYAIGDKKYRLYSHVDNFNILDYTINISFNNNGANISIYILHNDKKVELLDEVFYEYASIPCFDPYKIDLLKGLATDTKGEITFSGYEQKTLIEHYNNCGNDGSCSHPLNTLIVKIEDIKKR